MSYVDAFHDRGKDIVHVSERVDGKRLLIQHKPIYDFYVKDPGGKQRSVYGDPVTKISCKTNKDFRKNLAMYNHTPRFESDIKPLNKVLETNYLNTESPKLHSAFFDIEVAFQKYKYDDGHKVKIRKKK